MIRINEDYVVDVDAYNYTLMRDKHKKDKKGNPVMVTVGHYGNLENCLKGFSEEVIREQFINTDMSLKEAVDVIRKSNKELVDIIRRCMSDGSNK